MMIAFIDKNLEVSSAQAIALALVAITSLILLVVALANKLKNKTHFAKIIFARHERPDQAIDPSGSVQ